LRFERKGVHAGTDRDPGDVVCLACRQVRRHLEEDRRRPRPRLAHRREQLGESALVLQGSKARRVGRRDVDGQIVGERRHFARARGIIGDPVRAVLVRPDIDSDDPPPPALAAALEPAAGRFEAAVVEAHPVDHSPILGEPEQPRPRVPRLRLRGHGPDLDEAEPEAQHLLVHLGVLVEPRGEPDGTGKVEPGDPDGELWVFLGRFPRRDRTQRPDGQPMRPLRVEREDERTDEGVESHGPALWQNPPSC
jgi:hypothetical protein